LLHPTPCSSLSTVILLSSHHQRLLFPDPHCDIRERKSCLGRLLDRTMPLLRQRGLRRLPTSSFPAGVVHRQDLLVVKFDIREN
jgi:hypothetical protein